MANRSIWIPPHQPTGIPKEGLGRSACDLAMMGSTSWERQSILIGKGGEKLKQISTEARQDMEKLFGGKVWLETWVKVRGGWADDERALKSLGY